MMQLDNPPVWVVADQGLAALTANPLKQMTVYHWSKLSKLPKREYLIKGLLDRAGMSVIYGESNAGKTFLALDIAAHVALGKVWQGKRTRGGRVLYVAAESGVGVSERVTAFKLHHSVNDEDGDMYLIMETVRLCGVENDLRQLIEEISSIGGVDLVVIDTLARAMGAGNENASEGMGDFIHNCDVIREKTKAHVMIIHHSGKDADKGARGHSSLRAAIDTEIKVSKEDGMIVAEVTKQRDGKTGDRFGFSLELVEVGKDDDGESLISCALASKEIGAKKRTLSPQQHRAKKILMDCLLSCGENRKIFPDMSERMSVTLDEFKKALKDSEFCVSDTPASVAKAITRAIDALNDREVTYSHNGLIWMADKLDKADKSRQTNSG